MPANRCSGQRGKEAKEAKEAKEDPKAKILAKVRAEQRVFRKFKTRKECDAWVGPAGLALTYQDLNQAVWRYVGKRVRFRGKVFNARETREYAMFQIDACRGFENCNLMVVYPYGPGVTGTRVREGDRLWVYGYVLDEYRYTSTAGYQLAAPRIAMVGGIIFR